MTNADRVDDQTLAYRRCRFSTRLPRDRRYSAMHYWLLEVAPGRWRVGLTAFAVWRLGDIVEYDLTTPAGTEVAVGDEVGSIEGLKALVPLFAVGSGVLVREGAALRANVDLLESDPFGEGWLYEFAGEPGDDTIDVDEYVTLLDSTIDLLRRYGTAGTGASEADDDC